MMKFVLDNKPITVEKFYSIASLKENSKIFVSPSAWKKVETCFQFLKSKLEDSKPEIYYGINTGFGALSQTIIPKNKIDELQVNLVRSHCTGVGSPLSHEVVRGSILLRLHCLLQGHSGVSTELIKLMVKFLELQIIPYVPSQGSVGASGDLAPLAHIALCFIGEGKVYYDNKLQRTATVLKKCNLKPIILKAKEGLALINGTSVLTALGLIALHKSNVLIHTSDLVAAMTLDGMRGSIKPMDEDIQLLKPHHGQIDVAKKIRGILRGSKILNSHTLCTRVQDPYSLRCISQVHGAIRQTLKHATEVLLIEANSVTDNPLIFPKKDKIISGGNFHGEAAAFAMDYLAIGLSELANISERRIEKMTNSAFSTLPAFLVKDGGLNSGFMIAQVTAAALASENKILAHPASVDSIPTSTDKEDHVSMGMSAGLKCNQILENTTHVIAIELLAATQCFDLLRPLTSSRILENVYQKVRTKVAYYEKDRVFSEDIQMAKELIENNEIYYKN